MCRQTHTGNRFFNFRVCGYKKIFRHLCLNNFYFGDVPKYGTIDINIK